MTFTRSAAPRPEDLQPGTWMPWKWGATKPYPPTAVLCCPHCARACSLDPRTHAIAPDGTVSPSVVCPHTPCRFHEFARLAQWST